MPRQARILLPKSYYHIMTRGNNKNVVFRDEGDYRQYLALLITYKNEHPFDLFHYCLMPNHVHLLVKIKNAHEFAIFMKKLNLAYFHYYKNRYSWVGHFWQDRYKSQPVGKDAYFIQCGKYIELNPVRKEIVSEPADYAFSSYRYYTQGEENKLITEDMFYKNLGKNPEERQFKYKDIIIDELIETTYETQVWGTKYQTHQEVKKRRYYTNSK